MIVRVDMPTDAVGHQVSTFANTRLERTRDMLYSLDKVWTVVSVLDGDDGVEAIFALNRTLGSRLSIWLRIDKENAL